MFSHAVIFVMSQIKSSVSLQLFSSCVLLLLSLLVIRSRGTSKRRPPGPWRFPVLGSVTILFKKYGKIVAFQMGRGEIIWLNDMATIKEAFVTKGELISDRQSAAPPENTVRSEIYRRALVGFGIARTNYGKEFKDRKQLVLHSMRDFGFESKSLDETIWQEAESLVSAFSTHADGTTPTDIHHHFVPLAVSNVICSVAFGKRFDFHDEAFVEAIEAIHWLLNGQTFIDRIPILSLLPSAKRMVEKAKHQSELIMTFIETQIQNHVQDFDINHPRDFIDIGLQKSAFAEEGTKSSIGTDNIKKIIRDLFIAGTDTTAASLIWVILYMIHFPEIQKKCQKEIQDVLGSDGDLKQMPLQKDLPFTTATLLETQRISSIAPSSLPHLVKEDTTIAGYHIPKGAQVFANIRFLHLDETKWVAPFEFNPSRWIDPRDPNTILTHSNFLPFSMGKRRCLGEKLAKTEYFAFAVCLLSKFKLKMADPQNPPSLHGSGFVLTPLPFQVVMEPLEQIK